MLPTEDPGARMRVLRTLESLGAGVLREGAYLLPDTPANRQCARDARRIREARAGDCHVLRVKRRFAARSSEAFRRSVRPLGALREPGKDGRGAALGFGHGRPERDRARAAQAAARVREHLGARLLPHERARRARSRRIADADEAIKKLPISRQRPAAHRAGREPPGAHLGHAQAALGRPPGVRVAGSPLRRSGGQARCGSRKAQAVPKDAVGFGFEGAHFAASEAARHLRGDAWCSCKLGQRRARAHRRHRALPRSARHAGAGGRRRADAAAGRDAPRAPAIGSCSPKRRRPSTCSTRRTSSPRRKRLALGLRSPAARAAPSVAHRPPRAGRSRRRPRCARAAAARWRRGGCPAARSTRPAPGAAAAACRAQRRSCDCSARSLGSRGIQAHRLGKRCDGLLVARTRPAARRRAA